MLRDSVGRNLVMSVLRKVSPLFLMSKPREDELARKAIRSFDVRPALPEVPVGALSGGNQQKVVLARCLMAGPKVLLLDEPTRGVDVAAKAEILGQMRRLASDGAAVLFASSDIGEILSPPPAWW